MKKKFFVFILFAFCSFAFFPNNASAACGSGENGQVISPDMVKECEGVSDMPVNYFGLPKVIAGILFVLSFIPVGYGIKQLFQKNKTRKQVIKSILLCFSPLIPIISFIIIKIFENLM